MWVWRLANRDSWVDLAKPKNPSSARPWQCREFEIRELFNHHRLRQGWGVPGLDLNLTRDEWVENRYAFGAIDNEISMEVAEQEYVLMLPMRTEIRVKDTIFLPKVGNNQRSDDHFVVVTVAETYRFENRGQYPRPWDQYTWDQDYGHIITVDGNLTRTFPYSQTTLQSGDFGAPFLKRLVRVPDHRFYHFLQKQNYPFIP